MEAVGGGTDSCVSCFKYYGLAGIYSFTILSKFGVAAAS